MGKDFIFVVISSARYQQLRENWKKKNNKHEDELEYGDDYDEGYIDDKNEYYGTLTNRTELYQFRNQCEHLDGIFTFTELKEMAEESLKNGKYMDTAAYCIVLNDMSSSSYAIIRNT